MAINLDDRYPGRANGKTLDYPQGSFKDRTSPTSKDGTYLQQDWANDWAAFFQSLMSDAGLTANGIVDTAQASQYFDALRRSIQNVRNAGVDTGVVNALAVSLTPAPATLVAGMSVTVLNVIVANTGPATLNVNGLGVKPIVLPSGAALSGGEIYAGSAATFVYTGSSWVLQTMQPAAGQQTVGSSVASNAWTLTYGGGLLSFRNGTLSNGTPVNAVVPSNSITVPSGATLGAVSGQQATIALLEAYNGGAPVACVANIAGGMDLSETGLISPTTISSGATSAGTIYSASAVSANSPYRVVGMFQITETTAGTWATDATLKQGAGGMPFVALQSFGYGQTPQNVTASRALGTTYYNTTSRPIWVHVSGTLGSSNPTLTVTMPGGTSVVFTGNGGTSNAACFVATPIPPGASYVAAITGGSMTAWEEMR